MDRVEITKKIVVGSKSVIFWQKRRPGLPGKRNQYHQNLQIRESKSGRVSNQNHVSGAGRLHQWVLCMDFALPFSQDRKSTRLNSSHVAISYAVFCLKKKNHSRTNRIFHLIQQYQ